jgi:hypothetical protein
MPRENSDRKVLLPYRCPPGRQSTADDLWFFRPDNIVDRKFCGNFSTD